MSSATTDLGETDDELPYEDIFDPITEANTEHNALVTPVSADGAGLLRRSRTRILLARA